MKTERTDPYDGTVFIPKRANQIFFSRENQIAFNNEKARKAKESTKDIDKALKKNRRICQDIINAEKKAVIVSKDLLKGAGFNFTVFNRSIRLDNKPCTCIYEFYLLQENEQFKVGRLDGKY